MRKSFEHQKVINLSKRLKKFISFFEIKKIKKLIKIKKKNKFERKKSFD